MWQTEAEDQKEIDMSEKIEHVTDADFEQKVVESDLPVMVDFWAPWCGPCRMVGPILEELAGEYQGRVKVVKVNVDENNQTASSMGIRSIPTICLYREGKVKEVVVGVRPKSDLIALLDKVLAG
jgi:thioredoxin 1